MSLYFMDTDIKGHQLKRRSRPTFFETHCSRTSKEKRGKSYSKQKLELLQKLIAESCDSILLQPQAFSDEKLMKLLDGVGQKWDLNLLQVRNILFEQLENFYKQDYGIVEPFPNFLFVLQF